MGFDEVEEEWEEGEWEKGERLEEEGEKEEEEERGVIITTSNTPQCHHQHVKHHPRPT